MICVCVGLGSNVGDRLQHLRSAVESLRGCPEVEVLRSSSVYESEAVGPRQPDFLNAVVEIETSLGPRELLEALQQIERDLGRTPSQRWEPREIDLDILLYGDERLEEPDLVVPHPRISERSFVLVPMAELGLQIGGSPAQDLPVVAGPLI